ncbi:MAG: hypothetical protein ACK5LX_01935 [Oscillospiraceae bacterium]
MNKKHGRISAALLALLLAGTLMVAPVGALDESPNALPSSSAAKAETKTEEKKAETNPFKFEKSDVSALYAAQSGKFMVSPIYLDDENADAFISIINSLDREGGRKEIDLDSYEAADTIEGSFLLVMRDGTRIIYTLNKEGRIQVSSKGYQISTDAYNSLLRVYTDKKPSSSYAQWLIYMIPKRVEGISYETTAGSVNNIDSDAVWDILLKIRGIRVSDGSSYRPLKGGDLTPGGNTTKISLHFPEGGTYNLWFVGNTLYVETSDLHIGCQYTMTASDAQSVLNALKAAPAASGSSSGSGSGGQVQAPVVAAVG